METLTCKRATYLKSIRDQFRGLVEWDDDARFDAERALYWYANDYHSGQWSDLYLVLCNSPYRPGRMESGADPEDHSGLFYDWLAAEFNGQ